MFFSFDIVERRNGDPRTGVRARASRYFVGQIPSELKWTPRYDVTMDHVSFEYEKPGPGVWCDP